jgi:hypothetical protein
MRRIILSGALAGCVVATATGALGDDTLDDSSAKTTMAVFGDSPYGQTPTDTAEFQASPAFIDSINADPNVGLVIHVGDIHSGKQYCTQDYDQSIFDLWTRFQDPLVYTPGDNEWTDCNKFAEGGGAYNAVTGQIDYRFNGDAPIDYAKGDPIANLELVRSIFFSRPGHTLGLNDRHVLSQAVAFDPSYPTDAKYVENVIWKQAAVVFVTINLPGGSNDDLDPWYATPTAGPAQLQEKAERDGADLRWLDTAFALAKATHAKGVVILAQADMWDKEKGPLHQAAYEPYVASIAAHTADFGNPVLMFNGDSHVYSSGNPLSPSDPLYFMHPHYDVSNFHRVVVHGSTFPLEWLRLTVDPSKKEPNGPDAFGPFSWERVIPVLP